MGWTVEPGDGWDLPDVTAVLVVPFTDEGVGLPALWGSVAPGEHWCVAASRVLREEAGAGLSSEPPGPPVHPYAILRGDGLAVAAWCQVMGGGEWHGVEWHGVDRPLPLDVAPLRRLAADLRGRGLDDATWSRDVVRVLEEHYLRSPTPEGQSGKGGDAADWELARRLVIRPAHRDGTFLDLGCANGLLMESVHRWAAEEGRRLEPYGLDASERLVALARARLPQWRDRLFVGDALTWTPPHRFDFVHTMDDLVPPRRRPAWLRRCLRELVAPGGRLIVRGYQGTGDRLRSWGLPVAGTTVQERGSRRAQEAAWLEADG